VRIAVGEAEREHRQPGAAEQNEKYDRPPSR